MNTPVALAAKLRAEAEGRIANDLVGMGEEVSSSIFNWLDQETEAYRRAVTLEEKQKHSGFKIVVEAWEKHKKEQVA